MCTFRQWNELVVDCSNFCNFEKKISKMFLCKYTYPPHDFFYLNKCLIDSPNRNTNKYTAYVHLKASTSTQQLQPKKDKTKNRGSTCFYVSLCIPKYSLPLVKTVLLQF